MSIERCEKHSRHWDSDFMEMCPVCAIHADDDDANREMDLPTGEDWGNK